MMWWRPWLNGSSAIVMLSISRSTVDCNCTMFRPQRSSSDAKLFCTWNEDLSGQNVVQLQSTLLHKMLNISTAVTMHD